MVIVVVHSERAIVRFDEVWFRKSEKQQNLLMCGSAMCSFVVRRLPVIFSCSWRQTALRHWVCTLFPSEDPSG